MQVTPVTWNIQVRLVMFAQFIIILALDMSDPYWPLIIASVHAFNDPRILQYWSGIIYMAPLLTMIFTTLFWIKIGERIGYKKMILRAGFALAATQWSLVYFSSPWAILFIRLLQGGLAGFSTASQAWSLAITSTNTHSQIVGRLQAATAMGSIVGPICGAFISHYSGYLSIFIAAGCLCLLISVILANYLQENIHPIPSVIKKKQKTFLPEPQKNLLLLLICSAQAVRWMSTPFFALYVAKQLHASTLTLGLIYALIALAMSLTTPSVGWIVDRKSPRFIFAKYALIIAFLLSGIVQWCYAYITQVYWAFILSIVLGICLGIIALLLFSFLLKGVEEGSRGKLVGLGNTALKVGNLIGIIIGTIVQAEYNFLISFLFIGSCYFALAVFTMRYERANC